MATPGSSFTPTPLGHEDNLEVRHHPRANALQWRPDSVCVFEGHLLVRARNWYEIFGSALVQNAATNLAQLKAALTKTFPVVRNRKDLESQFYSSQQNRDQEPTDFIYDLLKIHKKLGLGMSEKALVDHIFVHLEPQVIYRGQEPENNSAVVRGISEIRRKTFVQANAGVEE
ncbi:uncharacterized protein TNCV_2542551 [Trichonephila clavipes]|nr:uncharacterized protein TNCV_2542551 [Trichonephila clavipes]